MNNNILIKLNKIKEFFIVFSLSLWTIIPVFKEIKFSNELITKYNLEYLAVILIGLLGVFFLFFYIYNNFCKAENKQEYCKQMLPIFILYIYMLWTLISTLTSNNIHTAIFGTSYRKDGYLTYIAYAGFFSLALNINSKKNRNFIINMLISMAILNIILVELYHVKSLRTILVPRLRELACFNNSNHYGYYLLLATTSSVFLFITQKNKIQKFLYFIASIFLLYFLILNDTFGCFVALLITVIIFIIYGIYKKKIKINLYIILSFILLIILLYTNTQIRETITHNIKVFKRDLSNIILIIQTPDEEESNQLLQQIRNVGSSRMELWIKGIEFFIDNPILGYGPDSLGSKYYKANITNDRPHNLLIQLATTSGIIGLFTYVTAIGIIIVRGFKSAKIDNTVHLTTLFVVIAYLISAMFGNSMYYTSPYFFIFLGLLMNENINNKI